MHKAGEPRKADQVRTMFASIAHRYDLLNHLLSCNIDSRWRKTLVGVVLHRLGRIRPRILDIGCGTADLALAFPVHTRVVGSDFCAPMLQIAGRKVHAAGRNVQIDLLAADALALPFCPGSFDAVVSAFVLRNLADRALGIVEMKRVLRPGGVVGILEFGMPAAPLLRSLYGLYFHRILPQIGRLISGSDGPYKYLPESVREFPGSRQLSEEMRQAGFASVDCRALTGGIAVLLTGLAS